MILNGSNPFGYRNLILLLLISGAAAMFVSPAFADPAVTISAYGSQSYYLGEKVDLSGLNNASASTYLFLTGPNLPATGADLSSPTTTAVSGDAGTFTVVSTNPDTTWDYSWYTGNLKLDAGSYTIFAASQPKAGDQLKGVPYEAMSIIVKKPFVYATISPSPVAKGQPFAITGIAEGVPPGVQIWIFGVNYAFVTTTPVNPDASFTFDGNATLSGQLPAGQDYLIVQHPMEDNQFDVVPSGNYVRDLKINNGTNLFAFTGPGSLQGSDAADALAAAFTEKEADSDTFTLIPFQVADTGSQASGSTAVMAAPTQQATSQVPIQYAIPVGAGILVVGGIILWKRL